MISMWFDWKDRGLLAAMLMALVMMLMLWPVSAAASIDLDEMSCGEFLHLKRAMLENDEAMTVRLTDTWIYGFAVAERQSTSMHPDEFYYFTSDITNRCAGSPGHLLLDVIRETTFRSADSKDWRTSGG